MVEAGSSQWLFYRLGEGLFAVSLGVVERVELAVAVTPLPQAPSPVLGVITVRGEVVPVLSGRAIAGAAPRPPRPDDRMVMVRCVDRRLAILVDEIVGVVEPDSGRWVAATPFLGASTFVTGILRIEEDLVVVTDLSAVLTPEQIGQLEAALDRLRQGSCEARS